MELFFPHFYTAVNSCESGESVTRAATSYRGLKDKDFDQVVHFSHRGALGFLAGHFMGNHTQEDDSVQALFSEKESKSK